MRLKPFNTLGVDARAEHLITLSRPQDLADTEFDPARDLVLGEGSNVLLAGDVPGTVILNRLSGRRILDDDGDSVVVEAAGGERWHDLVRWTLDQGLSGLENLSLIPGLAGAAPMQNIGAYGVELADHLVSLDAWDWRTGSMRTFSVTDCRFGYRDSHFKTGEPDRYLVTAIRLRLSRPFTPRLDYPGLATALAEAGIDKPTARDVSDAVSRVRQSKLPDPAVIGNAGSFFRNPVIEDGLADDLRGRFAGLPVYPAADGQAKLSAGWMIEHCGWKGFRDGDAGISEQHALVLVNHGSATGRQLVDLAWRVRDSVAETFGVTLENEPRVIEFPGHEH
ncbi:UDP-N-acetylmuramate dehydrogenase [Marinihelvus fidelis]|uniref:UDP-N-acetylenolpyruvoylglucosamine reductase n=1 Tax=Marinihelvus fidelis TaxID=2613842 RepID=A0A5N0TDW3_9GAMM|nr:UDP-N-acetylmuramate dehydrogenase [Marinihelvus fidelis]KAA9133283.1 UDP-N-acetylmuramate dehydrogenase [Marinihelvus fidelis]